MSISNNTYLPTYEDLHVPPLNLTSPVLKAGAIHFGVYCNKESNEFMLCNKEEKDPRKCLEYNKKVSNCASEFFHKVRDNCAETFTNYWKCIDVDPKGRLSYQGCTALQAEFDKCMKDKLNITRPPVGDLSRIRLHETKRDKPVPHYKNPPIVLPPVPTLEDADKHKEAKDSIKRSGDRLH